MGGDTAAAAPPTATGLSTGTHNAAVDGERPTVLRSLKLEWDMGTVVYGVILMMGAFFCALCLLEEVRRIYARRRFERATNVPIAILLLSALLLTVGAWVAEIVFIVSVHMEDAAITFDAGITLASVLAPLPLAAGALASLAEAARKVAIANADTSMSIESASVENARTRALRIDSALSGIRNGAANVQYGYLLLAGVCFSGWAVMMHFVIVDGLDVDQATMRYKAGTAVGGALLCIFCMLLSCWLMCLLPEASGSKEVCALVMTIGSAGLFFTSISAIEFEVDEMYFHPMTKQRHSMLVTAVVGLDALVNILCVCTAAVLARRQLYNNHFLGITFGLAMGIALDFLFDDRWHQMPLLVFMGLLVVSALLAGGVGEYTALGFAVGCGYAYGPFLDTKFVSFGIGAAALVLMLFVSVLVQYGLATYIEYRDAGIQKRRERKSAASNW